MGQTGGKVANSLAYRGLPQSGRLCDSRIDAFHHAVDKRCALLDLPLNDRAVDV